MDKIAGQFNDWVETHNSLVKQANYWENESVCLWDEADRAYARKKAAECWEKARQLGLKRT